MISHKHNFIFIHIPRTGGTSIEEFFGTHMWKDSPDEKHLSAKEAKKLYGEEIWNSYFKFSFVRNPWDRVVSLWKSSLYIQTPSVYRFLLLFKPRPHEYKLSSYVDILDLELDFIGKFENLQNDFEIVLDKLGIKKAVLPHLSKRVDSNHYSYQYNAETKAIVEHFYKRDIEKFSYFFLNKSMSMRNDSKNRIFSIIYIIKFKICRLICKIEIIVNFFLKHLKLIWSKKIKC